VISIAVARPGRSSFLARLVRSSGSDLADYWTGIADDFHTLATDLVAAPIAAAVILSQVVDALTTLLALANNSPEGNPISAAVIASWGVPGLLIEKAVISVVVVFNMARLRGRSSRWLGALAVLVGFAAAAWNLHFSV
jgi:hypothetical protein